MRKNLLLENGGIRHFRVAVGPAFHFHENVGYILARNTRIHPLDQTSQRPGLSHQVTAHIEHVRTDIGQYKAVKLRQKGLVVEHGKCRTKGNPGLERLADHT